MHKKRWFVVFCFLAFLFFIALGSWQLQRLAWKNALERDINAKAALPAITLTGNETELERYTRIKASGQFLNAQEILFQAKYYDGVQGLHVVTPFQLKNGAIMIVNRGWVPKEKKLPDTRKESQNGKNQTIEAVVMEDEHPAWFLPKNDPAKGFWMWRNTPELVSAIQAENPKNKIIPLYFRQVSNEKKTWPRSLDTNIKLRNDHLEYALTWYSLAVITLVMSVIYYRKKS